MTATLNPLLDPPPPQVPLPRAPLVRVLAQVRFPGVLNVEKADFVAGFQDRIRDEYPISTQEVVRAIVLTPQGPTLGNEQKHWRFEAIDHHWRLTLTSNFVTLETTEYTSRVDFLTRLTSALSAVAEVVKPGLALRIGVRYIARITGQPMQEIACLLRPEVLGVQTAGLDGSHAQWLTEGLFDVPQENGKLLARWGRLPAQATVDPSAVMPINEPSWILDFDVFTQTKNDFVAADIAEICRRLSDRQYAVFRWFVTDDFLRTFGGQV